MDPDHAGRIRHAQPVNGPAGASEKAKPGNEGMTRSNSPAQGLDPVAGVNRVRARRVVRSASTRSGTTILKGRILGDETLKTQNPWPVQLPGVMLRVRRQGLEPRTRGLRVRCSAY